MKKSKLDQPKEKPAEKKQSGCKVCEVLKNALKSVDINKQAQVWESISVEVCKDKKVEGIEAAVSCFHITWSDRYITHNYPYTLRL